MNNADNRDVAGAAEAQSVPALIDNIKNPDDAVRGPAWQSAPRFGAPAVKPLFKLLADPDFEAARAAKRALWKIVRHAGRPGAGPEREAVAAELVLVLQNPAAAVRREALWMLSELGREDAVAPVAALLADQDVHDDARAALERIPGERSLAALKKGLTTAPEEYRPAIAQSLRARGVPVSGYPSQKLVPKK
jgi:HEAT repeat protein